MTLGSFNLYFIHFLSLYWFIHSFNKLWIELLRRNKYKRVVFLWIAELAEEKQKQLLMILISQREFVVVVVHDTRCQSHHIQPYSPYKQVKQLFDGDIDIERYDCLDSRATHLQPDVCMWSTPHRDEILCSYKQCWSEMLVRQ